MNSALQRARSTVAERVPAQSQQATLRAVGDARVREVVQSYVAAWERNDIEAIRALLVEDAIFAMPPYPEWWRGREAIAQLFIAAGAPRIRHVAISANAQRAVAWYVWDPDRRTYTPSALEVLTLEGAGIKQITAFVLPALFSSFGLPDEVAPERDR